MACSFYTVSWNFQLLQPGFWIKSDFPARFSLPIYSVAVKNFWISACNGRWMQFVDIEVLLPVFHEHLFAMPGLILRKAVIY